MDYKTDVKYQKSHEWAKAEGDVVIVGISDYAQDSLGDVVFVELPETGATFSQGDSFGVVESVKAASDVFVPVSGEVVAINEELNDNPEIINEDPFGKGWIIKVKLSDPSEVQSLMDASAYETYTAELDD